MLVSFAMIGMEQPLVVMNFSGTVLTQYIKKCSHVPFGLTHVTSILDASLWLVFATTYTTGLGSEIQRIPDTKKSTIFF